MSFDFSTKKIKLSDGRYAHSRIRVRPKTRKNAQFEKRALSLKNSSPDSKADFSEKFLFGIWRLIALMGGTNRKAKQKHNETMYFQSQCIQVVEKVFTQISVHQL